MEVKNVKRGIRRRIVISMLIIGIAPLVAGLYLTYLDGTNALRKSIGANFQELAKETANKVDMVIKKEIIDVQRLAISSEVKDAVKNKKYGSSELIDYLNKFKSFNEKEVYAMIVVDTKGRYVGGFKEDVEKNYSNEKWFKDSINNSKVYVGDLKLDDTFGMHLMSIAAPVIDYERVIAVVVIKYSVDKLLEVVNSVRIEKTGHATLVDSKGSILMCPIFPPRSHNANRSLIRLISSSKPGWDVAEDDAHGGRDSIIGFAPVEATLNTANWFDGNRWYVFLRQSPSEMYAPIYSLLLRVSIFGSVLIALLSLTGVYAAKNIVRPINELYKGVKFITQGKLDYRLNIKTNDEIEKLADEFNKMAGELQRTYTALEERNKELETSESRYKDLVENSPEMIHSVDINRYFVHVNKTELNILGYTLQEMQNKKIEDVVPDEDKEKLVKHIARSAKEGISTIETQFISKVGKRTDVEVTATAQYHPLDGHFVKTRAFVRDITDRKKLEGQLKEYYDTLEQKVNSRTKELKETKEYLENLLETANDVIYTLNHEGIITYVNKKVEEWGYKKDELIGKSFLTILSSRHQGDRFRKTVTEGIRHTYEVEVIDKQGGIKYAALSVSPLRSNEGKIVEVLGIAKDITSQKLLEQQVIQAEKMSAIGQLAAGIAHEINNPLGGILNCLYNLRKKKLSPEREDEYIKSMEDGIHRVQRTVDQLLDFSLQHEPELASVNINSLIEGVLSLIGYAIKKDGIKLKKELDPSLQQLMVDQHKMSQVLMNILLNAVQAMKGKGQIRVKTFQEDGWCCIEVMDNGEGIPPHIFPKIFDPFFTTKDVGKGTGLGLAVSRGIVEKHSGRIEARSELGKGTTFTIKLPVNK